MRKYLHDAAVVAGAFFGVRELEGRRKENVWLSHATSLPIRSNVKIRRDAKILERAANRPTLTVTNDAVMVRQMVDYLRDRLEIEDAPISLEEAIGGSVHRGSSLRPFSLCSRWSDSGRCS